MGPSSTMFLARTVSSHMLGGWGAEGTGTSDPALLTGNRAQALQWTLWQQITTLEVCTAANQEFDCSSLRMYGAYTSGMYQVHKHQGTVWKNWTATSGGQVKPTMKSLYCTLKSIQQSFKFWYRTRTKLYWQWWPVAMELDNLYTFAHSKQFLQGVCFTPKVYKTHEKL